MGRRRHSHSDVSKKRRNCIRAITRKAQRNVFECADKAMWNIPWNCWKKMQVNEIPNELLYIVINYKSVS